jgi:hypothetical protein
VKKEEEDQSAADGSEQPSPSRSVIPLLQNTQGYDSGIYSDCGGSLKLSALVKSECSDYTGSCSAVCADNNKESTSDRKKTDSKVEDSKCIVGTFISDFSKSVQRCSNKPVQMDPIVRLPRLQLSTTDSSGTELRDSKSSVSSIEGASVAECPTEQDIIHCSDCLYSLNDSEGKTSIFSQQINKHTTQKKVSVDGVEKLSKEYSEQKSKQQVSGFSSAKIPEHEIVTCRKSMMQMDKIENLAVGSMVKQSRRLSSNYKFMKCLCGCDTAWNAEEKRNIHKACRSRCSLRTDEIKSVSVDRIGETSANCKLKQCLSDCNSTKDTEGKGDFMRPQDSCEAEQKKTVKADGTVKHCKELSSKYQMMQHSRADVDNTPYHCDRCNKQYATSHGLQDHYMFHTGSRPFVCKVCAKMFPTLMQLVKHSQRHTRDKAYECQLCDKKFRFLISLKTHILFHTGERPFECILCNKRFFTSLDLKNHIHIHTGEKPFVCKLCWKGFSSTASLRKHRFHHARGKPYFCKSCNMQFERYRLLRQHIERHKVKKYECRECHNVFSSLEILKKHALSHSAVRPYACPLCNSTF